MGPAELFNALQAVTLEQAQKWESDLQALNIKEVSSEKKIVVVNAKFAAPFPVSGRQFVNAKISRDLGDGSFAIVQTGINHPDFKADATYVRGVVLISGYLFRAVPDQPDKTEVLRVTAVDPKGN